jgi:G3E family GTPase
VLVNEFGDVGLDHHLVQRVEEHTLLLGNGCVCCTVRDDLVRALGALLDQDQRGTISRLQRVVVETTGLADPAPVLFTIGTDPMLQHHFRVEGVVATVDAINGQAHLDRHPASRKQVVVADEIIVTKTDMVPPDTVELLVDRLRQMNPSAPISAAIFGDVDPDRLWRPGRGMPPAARVAAEGSGPAASHRRAAAAGQPHHAAEATRAIAFTFEQPLDWIAFSVWLSMLLHAHGEEVLRVKGLLNVGTAGPVVLNGVQHIIHAPEHLAAWPDADHRSRLVFILQGLNPHDITQSLQAFQHLLGARPCTDDIDLHR